MKILVLNSGSSSQKSALFDLVGIPSDDPVPPLWQGKLQWDGDKEELHISNQCGQQIKRKGEASGHRAAVEAMLENLWSGETAVLQTRDEIQVVGHRIVHGGPKLTEPVRITAEVQREIEAVSSIAPLHNQAGLEGIELIEKLLPDVPQIAIFDTGFHRTLPPEAYIYPVPYDLYERDGIRRFGFHGINHEYCAHRASKLLQRDIAELKIVTCHLGNGCSLCAIDGGKSVDTTMGFTPLEGLMMGTRSGSIDPGILTYLLRTRQIQPNELDNILNHDSGLLGVSGISSDMRDVLEAIKQRNARAKLAFDIFVHRLQKEVAAMAASLGGIDALVFTAGIGENSPEVRSAACARLRFIGVQIDDSQNTRAKADADVSTPGSRIHILLIQAQEEWAIARECVRLA